MFRCWILEDEEMKALILHYSKEMEAKLQAYAKAQGVNYDLFVGLLYTAKKKYGFEICDLCGRVSEKKECACGDDEIKLSEEVKKYLQKKLANPKYLCNLIGSLTKCIENNEDDSDLTSMLERIESMLSERVNYRGFGLATKNTVSLEDGRKHRAVQEYWYAYISSNKKVIWVYVGKDKRQYKAKIDAWLAKPENWARLSEGHKARIESQKKMESVK